MKFLTLASLLLVPSVWAAAAPYQCKTVGKSVYFYAQGPHESMEFFKVSEKPIANDTYNLVDDIWVDEWTFNVTNHYDVARCHLRTSSSSLPQSYVRIHLSKNTTQCVTMGGPGPEQEHVPPGKESFTESNLLLLKPCAHPSSPMFPLQLFRDLDDEDKEDDFPYFISTLESENRASRHYVGFRHDKAYVMARNPKEDSVMDLTWELQLNPFKD